MARTLHAQANGLRDWLFIAGVSSGSYSATEWQSYSMDWKSSRTTTHLFRAWIQSARLREAIQ